MASRKRGSRRLGLLRGRLSAPIATLTTVAFLATFAPPRLAHAVEPLSSEPMETPKLSDTTNGVRGGADGAASALKATKARKAPVSAKGSFTTSVAIQVPPGRLGMTPSLSLNYDSSSVAESAVGVGWSFGAPSISRSTRQGFPKVNGHAAQAYDDAEAVFTGPSGEMVPATDGPAGASMVYAPIREASPVRYEYQPSGAGGGFIEHDPSGKKRWYGLDPAGRTARVRNELGTHSWLLLYEEDRHGNSVKYTYQAPPGASAEGRPDPRKAQSLPILSTVEWGGTALGPTPFAVRMTREVQDGPLNLLEGNTLLDDRINNISVSIDGVIVWSYVLAYTTSETGKSLLASVRRTGDSPETTTFSYSAGAPAFVLQPALPDRLDATYTNNYLAYSGIDALYRAIGTHPDAMQVAGFRSGVKFIDVDGNGTTDAIYHGAGLGPAATHVLWEESSLQAPSPDGLGGWSMPALGTTAGPAVQPGTGLPYFPFHRTHPSEGWDRSDFATSMLHDLSDLDGDGDADGVALPQRITVRPGTGVGGVLNPQPPEHLPFFPGEGQMQFRFTTNTAKSAHGVSHVPEQIVGNWPSIPPVATDVWASRDPNLANAPLKYRAAPSNDLQMPIVDLNADGKSDVVLLKRRSLGANFLLPGQKGAFGIPKQGLKTLFAGGVEGQYGDLREGRPFDTEITRLVREEEMIVLVETELLLGAEPPGSYVELRTNAGRLNLPELPEATPITMMGGSGTLPIVPGGPPPIPEGPPAEFTPTRLPNQPWWWPRVDPDGDVWVPLRDWYTGGSNTTGATLFQGEFRFVPRTYLMRGDAVRSLVPEPEENRSRFEQSLQNILNNGSPDICLTFNCTYLPHPNFNSYFADVNGDGLPDLISANRPVPQSDSDGNPFTVCEDGHQVHLNRGYGFETDEFETFPHTWTQGNTASALYLVTNRDRFCASDRPRIQDRSAPMAPGFGLPEADLPKYPMAAMANTDINGDGRPDIVFAYQPSVHSADVDQKIFVNTGRGFAPSSIQLPADVALARNMRPSLQPYAPIDLRVWPRAGLADMARFVDLDNDGLVDIVRAGMSRAVPPLGEMVGDRAVWYRNMGDIPDRLERISSTSGAWTSIEYAAPKSEIVHIPEDGQHPPATMRVVKTIRSASGPVPTPAGYDPFPVQEIRLSYDNFVKDLLSNEVVGFEKVVADFVNSFNDMPRETVRVTRTFEVRPEIADVNGVVPSLRHPLKGALVSTHTIDLSSGHVSTDTSEYRLETRGAGVVVRPLREIHGEISPSGATAYSAEETVSFGDFGNPTERATGNWDGTAIAPPEQRRTTGIEYDNRITDGVWQIGLVSREQTLGYSEDIDGNVDPAHVLGETVTTYDAKGLVSSTKRMNIRAPGCAGLADDETTYEYFAHGLVKKTHDTAGFAAPGGDYLRDVTFTYDAKSLYVASASTNVGRMNGASFQPVSRTLNVAFLTDLRHGKTTKTTDPNGAATFATYDSTGRVLTRKGADNVVLESNVYVDAFPVSQTSTITTDVNKTFLRYTQRDADDHVLSMLEAPPNQATWARKTKVRLDAFGRPVESFLTASVVGTQGGAAPATGPKDVTSYDGFDRATQVVAADGTTTSTVYEPRQTTETNARAIQTARVYDSFGELVSVERNVGGAAGETSSHSFVRDGRGDIVRVTDGDGSVRRIERDGGGRVRHVTLPHQPGATPGRFTMCHDVADKLVSLETPAGREVAIVHDQLGRTLKTTATDVSGLTVTTSQTYDSATAGAWGLGRLAQKNDESGIYNIKYDSYGRLKNVAYSPSVRAKAGATNVAATYTADFAYTPANLLKSVNFYGLPSAASLTYTRDVQGRAKIVDTKVGTTTRTLVADVTYDRDDRITVARYGNGTSGEWTFNPLTERLDRIAYKTSSSAVLAAVGMSYDANDNLLAESRERQGVAGLFSQKLHTYDPLDRLHTSDAAHPGGNQSETYTFSASGNIMSAGTDAYTYASDVTSQAVSHVADIWGEKQRALGYDADGYLATDQETRADGSSSTRSLEFDPTGCMRSITREDLSAGGTTTSAASEYTCGLDGKVVARDTVKLDGSRSRRIDFAGLAEIRPDEGIFMLRVPLSGTVSVEDARSLATGARVTAMSGYVLADARGSVLATTGFDSASPGFTREADYDAWGKTLAGYSALSAPRHGFAGAEADAAAGTYSFGARTYDPTLRRWVSPDPLLALHPRVDEGVGEALNLFSYADGNPVKKTDKSGFFWQIPVAIVFVYVAFGTTWASDDTAKQQKAHEHAGPVEKAFMAGGVVTAPLAAAGVGATLAMRGGAAAAAPAAVARETGNATAKAAPAAEKTAAQQAAAKGASAGAARAGSGLTKAESAGLRQLFGNSNRGSKQLLGRLTGGEKVALPPGVTSQTLRTYREIAVKSISQGKDTLGVQAARKEAIDALLKQQTPK